MRARNPWAIPLGLAALLLGALAVRAAPGAHTRQRLSLQAWLERAQREGSSVATDRPVTIKGMTEAVFTPRLPDHLIAAPLANQRYILAAFGALDGHRLLLAPEAQVASLPHLPLVGVTLTPESIGLPEAPLAELRKALPNLDTHFVTGLGWGWRDGGDAGWVVSALLAGLAIACAAAAIGAVTARAPERGRRGATRGGADVAHPA